MVYIVFPIESSLTLISIIGAVSLVTVVLEGKLLHYKWAVRPDMRPVEVVGRILEVVDKLVAVAEGMHPGRQAGTLGLVEGIVGRDKHLELAVDMLVGRIVE